MLHGKEDSGLPASPNCHSIMRFSSIHTYSYIHYAVSFLGYNKSTSMKTTTAGSYTIFLHNGSILAGETHTVTLTLNLNY